MNNIYNNNKRRYFVYVYAKKVSMFIKDWNDTYKILYVGVTGYFFFLSGFSRPPAMNLHYFDIHFITIYGAICQILYKTVYPKVNQTDTILVNTGLIFIIHILL